MSEVPTNPNAGEPQGSTPPPPQVSPDGRFYWDGRQWAPLAPSTDATPESLAAGAERSWFVRHKALTTLGGVVVVVIVIAAINGAREPTTTDPAGGLPAGSSTSPAPAAPPSAASASAPDTLPTAMTAAARAEEPAASPATTQAAEPTFTMPALVGMNLQLAQDTLQALGSYLMDQQDASGLGRVQVVDSNWQVFTQDPAPDALVPESTLVTLGAVKLDETCP